MITVSLQSHQSRRRNQDGEGIEMQMWLACASCWEQRPGILTSKDDKRAGAQEGLGQSRDPVDQ